MSVTPVGKFLSGGEITGVTALEVGLGVREAFLPLLLLFKGVC